MGRGSKVSGFEGPEACNFNSGFWRIANRNSVVASEGTMRPNKPRTTGGDLFQARVDQNHHHELVQLAARIDWDWIDRGVAPL